jgi:hypothetical protein
MRTLSAAEAISPAIDRTKDVLFRPFRKGRSWKLAATAYLSAMGCFFLPIPLAILILPWMATPATMSKSTFVAVTACGLAIYSAFLWLLFYFGARLEFVLFDIVLFKAELVAPVWRKYSPQTWRWIGLKVAFGTVVSVIAGIPIAYWGIHAFSRLAFQPGQPPPPGFVNTFVLLPIFFIGWFSLLFLASSLLGDFVLPSLALENATVSVAMGRFMALLRAEPGQVFFFCCFKVLLGIVALIAMELAIFIAEFVVAIPLGVVGFFGWLILHQLGAAGVLMMTVGAVLLYVAFVVFFFYFVLGMQGCIMTFFQAYGMYFLGGRYPLLGDMMDRFIPQPYPYPAGFPTSLATPQIPPPTPPEAL